MQYQIAIIKKRGKYVRLIRSTKICRGSFPKTQGDEGKISTQVGSYTKMTVQVIADTNTNLLCIIYTAIMVIRYVQPEMAAANHAELITLRRKTFT